MCCDEHIELNVCPSLPSHVFISLESRLEYRCALFVVLFSSFKAKSRLLKRLYSFVLFLCASVAPFEMLIEPIEPVHTYPGPLRSYCLFNSIPINSILYFHL